MILTNPLTNDEKLSISRLLDHNGLSAITYLYAIIERASLPEQYSDIPINWRKTEANLDAIINLLFCHRDLQLREITMTGNHRFDVERILEDIDQLYGEKTKLNKGKETIGTLEGLHSPLTLIIRNLISNANKASRGREVQFGAEKYSGFPSSPTYLPVGADQFKNFVRFYVHDNGRGFPQDFDYQKAFTIEPPKGGHGFGLYFTGLVAKVLRAPVNIKSKPGDTTVSFYHPVYAVE